MIGKFREQTTPFVRAVAAPVAALGISPNIFSALAIPLALAAGWFITQNSYGWGFVLAVLAVSIDLFDGAVARLQKKESLFGNYFETMVDKAVEIILFVACAFIFPVTSTMALGLSMLASYAKPRAALVIISDNHDWPAIGEHSERMLLLLGGLLLSAFKFKLLGLTCLELSLLAIAIISGIGSVQRVLYAKKLIVEAQRKGAILPYLKKKKR